MLFAVDLDAVVVNLDAKIADSVQGTCWPSSQAEEMLSSCFDRSVSSVCPRGDLNPHAR
jgi:hypothetical protein